MEAEGFFLACQVHLGFYETQEAAARAYDRAAINKGAQEDGGKIVTNFAIKDYGNDLDILRRITQDDLVSGLSSDVYVSNPMIGLCALLFVAMPALSALNSRAVAR